MTGEGVVAGERSVEVDEWTWRALGVVERVRGLSAGVVLSEALADWLTFFARDELADALAELGPVGGEAAG